MNELHAGVAIDDFYHDDWVQWTDEERFSHHSAHVTSDELLDRVGCVVLAIVSRSESSLPTAGSNR